MKFVRKKDSFLMWHVLHWLVFIFTFGGNKRFRNYWTTIGNTIYYPERAHGKLDKPFHQPVIEHEKHHISQFKKLGFGNAVVGVLPFAILYLFLPFPVLFSFRYWFERPAYLVGIKAKLSQFGPSRVLKARLIDRAVEKLCGPDYGWAGKLFPGEKRTRAWFERELEFDKICKR